MDSTGAQEGAAVVSEMHERERANFEANNSVVLSVAARHLGVAKLNEAIASLLHVLAFAAFVATVVVTVKAFT